MKKAQQLLEAANAYIEKNRQNVDMRYRPRFHATAPIGWINDPNGFFFDGKWYHLFYQHYPYGAQWNDMHWGHWRSRDLVKWENLPIVMAPDMPYDVSGCFSGSAVPDGQGGAHILYTGVSEEGRLQQQCYAHFDGGQMRKADRNPVIPFSALPAGYKPADFRDPKLFRTQNGYRAVIAAKSTDGAGLVSFSSPDLEKWTFDGPFCQTEGVMPECPDVFSLDGHDIVLYSKVPEKGDADRPVLYSLDSMNPERTSFAGQAWKRMDYGREFYATQTCKGADGETVAVSWMASWETKYPTAVLAHGWSGMMTLPRLLHVQDGRLIQEPVPGLKKLRGEKNRISAELNNGRASLQGIGARHAEIHFRADVTNANAVALNVMEDQNERVSLLWIQDTLIMNRTTIAYNQMGRFIPEISMPLHARDGKLEMTVFVDNCSIEVFAYGDTMSAIAFPKGEAYDLSVSVKGKARIEAECWKID